MPTNELLSRCLNGARRARPSHAVAVAIVAMVAACGREAPDIGSSITESAGSRALIRVGERQVATDEFRAAVTSLPGADRRLQRPGGAEEEADRFVEAMLIEEEAKARGLLDDPAFQRRRAAIRAQATRQEREVLQQLLYARVAEEVQITDEELRAYYEASKHRFLTSRVHLWRIAVEDESAARAAHRRVGAGEDFIEIAKELNTDSVLRENGGDLGWTALSELVPGLREVAMGLVSDGSMSEPFEFHGTWNLLRLVRREEQQQPKEFDVMRHQLDDELRRKKANAKFRQVLDERRAVAGVAIDPDLLAQIGPPRDRTARDAANRSLPRRDESMERVKRGATSQARGH